MNRFLRRLLGSAGGALASFGLSMYAAPPEMQRAVDERRRAAAEQRRPRAAAAAHVVLPRQLTYSSSKGDHR